MEKDYYIQGNAARAEEIKASFEAKGIDTTAINVGDEDFLYFSSDGLLYFEEFSNTLLKVFKTHPGYKELPLPVIPEFDVGDWIVRGIGFVYEPSLITEIRDYYICELQNGERVTYTLNDVHKNFHLWTVQDAKSGDVLACSDWLFILKQFNVERNKHKTYCHYDLTLKGFKDDTDSYMVTGSDEFHPATKEQRRQLFAKMREAGYQWDENKKELKKIPKHYDISSFYAGMPVLTRADNVCRWDYSVFSRITGNEDWQFAVCNGVSVAQCIPFEGNEHLLGTTDMCDERFINW